MEILQAIGLILFGIVAIPTGLMVGSILLVAVLYIMVIIYAAIIQVIEEIKGLFHR